MRRPLLALIALLASGCGSGAGASTPTSTQTHAGGDAGALPNRIYLYRVTDTPDLHEGGETVFYDPASGDARDRSGIGTGIRQLVVVRGGEAIQADWNGAGRPDTIVTTGSPGFVRANSYPSATWLLDAYLRHRLGHGRRRVAVSHAGGHLRLTSGPQRDSVSLTLVRSMAATRTLVARLFALHVTHVTERIRQLQPAASAHPLPGAYWLGPSWHGRPLEWALVDAPAGRAKRGEITYGVTYAGDAVQVSSSLPPPGIGRMLADTRIFGTPHPCTLADGSAARISQLPKLPPRLLAKAGAAPIEVVYRRIVSRSVDVSVIGSRALLPSLPATCRALRPFAGRSG
jgi:hypothetical protein